MTCCQKQAEATTGGGGGGRLRRCGFLGLFLMQVLEPSVSRALIHLNSINFAFLWPSCNSFSPCSDYAFIKNRGYLSYPNQDQCGVSVNSQLTFWFTRQYLPSLGCAPVCRSMTDSRFWWPAVDSQSRIFSSPRPSPDPPEASPSVSPSLISLFDSIVTNLNKRPNTKIRQICLIF